MGTQLLFGVRPHDLRPAEGDPHRPRFAAKVNLTEPLGDVTVLDLDARGERLRMVLPEERALGYRKGDSLDVELAVQQSHLFTVDTGTAVR